MRVRRLLLFVPLTLALVLAGSTPRLEGARADLPAKLSDQEFWKLTESLSEPNGQFRSENLLSNEMVLWKLVPELIAKVKPGGVYMGVGPEQNFSYMAAVKSRMAFITDIRRGNLFALLMYKAVFELSADRVEFVSRLFTKARPAGISASSSIKEIMDAFWAAPTGDEAAYTANLNAIKQHLTKTRGLPLSAEDLDGIGVTYRAFYWYGPAMNYNATTSLTASNAGNAATYWHLMTQIGEDGKPLSYLASEEKFGYIKDMYNKNLIIPVVGNFSGPKAIRAIGTYVREHGSTVSAFYVSTVEPYLKRDGSFPNFCASVETLPVDASSVFIRPGNPQNLNVTLSANGRATVLALAPPGGTPMTGTYQTGIIVPIIGGCG
jgi:hypothetical protein